MFTVVTFLTVITSCHAISNLINKHIVDVQDAEQCLYHISSQTCRDALEDFTNAARPPYRQWQQINGSETFYYYYVKHRDVYEYCCVFFRYKRCALAYVDDHCPLARKYVIERLGNKEASMCAWPYDYQLNCVEWNVIQKYVHKYWDPRDRVPFKVLIVFVIITFVVLFLILFRSCT